MPGIDGGMDAGIDAGIDQGPGFVAGETATPIVAAPSVSLSFVLGVLHVVRSSVLYADRYELYRGAVLVSAAMPETFPDIDYSGAAQNVLYRVRAVNGSGAGPFGQVALLCGPRAAPSPVDLSRLEAPLRLRALDGSALTAFRKNAEDTAPPLRVQVVHPSGDPVSLAGCTAEFHLVPRTAGNGAAVHSVGSITAPEAGFVSYEWQEGDAVAGSYRAVFVLSDSFGSRITLPAGGGMAVEIT